MTEPEPKTMLPSYWEQRELYMKNSMAYEAARVFEYYARQVHENHISEEARETAIDLAQQQAAGFEQEGILAKHVTVPFATQPEMVEEAIKFIDKKLQQYDEDRSGGVKHRLKTYKEELERQTDKTPT